MRNLILFAAAASAVLAQPALAQAVSASAYKATLEFAGCVVDADGASARALLATVPNGPQADTAASRLLANNACGDKKGSAAALRGAVAERVYLKQYPAPPAELAGPAAPFTGSGNVDLVYYDITRCTAARDPLGADMLVRAEPRSDAEKAALRRIVPVIGACTPAGGQIGFDREKMRGLIAEGLIAVRAGQGSN